MSFVVDRISRVYRPPVCAAVGRTEPAAESAAEFVAYFYEFVREDAALVLLLDKVLKGRYGLSGTCS